MTGTPRGTPALGAGGRPRACTCFARRGFTSRGARRGARRIASVYASLTLYMLSTATMRGEGGGPWP